MSKPEQIVAFTVRLAASEHEALGELARSEHRSLGAEARKAIVEHLRAVGNAEAIKAAS